LQRTAYFLKVIAYTVQQQTGAKLRPLPPPQKNGHNSLHNITSLC